MLKECMQPRAKTTSARTGLPLCIMHHGQVESAGGPAWRVEGDGVEAVGYGVELPVRPLPAVECESRGPALPGPGRTPNDVPQRMK